MLALDYRMYKQASSISYYLEWKWMTPLAQCSRSKAEDHGLVKFGSSPCLICLSLSNVWPRWFSVWLPPWVVVYKFGRLRHPCCCPSCLSAPLWYGHTSYLQRTLAGILTSGNQIDKLSDSQPLPFLAFISIIGAWNESKSMLSHGQTNGHTRALSEIHPLRQGRAQFLSSCLIHALAHLLDRFST